MDNTFCSPLVFISIFLFHFPAGYVSVRNSNTERAVADAAELSSACQLATGIGEGLREADKTASRLPFVAHYRADIQVPYRNTTEVLQG